MPLRLVSTITKGAERATKQSPQSEPATYANRCKEGVMPITGFGSAASTSDNHRAVRRRSEGDTLMSHQITAPDVAGGFTCLVGPPGSGVTAMTTELGRCLQPAAPSNPFPRQAGSPSTATADAGPASSRTGSISARMALVHVQLGAGIGSVAVLPRSPVNVAQLPLLQMTTRALGVRLSVIELDAPDLVLAGRVYARRSRPTCDHTRHGGTLTEGGAGEPCPRCGDHRMDWRIDEMHAFLDRLHAYRLRQRGLRLAAAELGIPWVRLVSSADCGTRVSAVRAVLSALVTGGPLPPVARPQPAARHTTRAAGSSQTQRPTNSGNTPPAPTRPLTRAGPLRPG
jgi:hypothetical protein